jgi:hypothetical protein
MVWPNAKPLPACPGYDAAVRNVAEGLFVTEPVCINLAAV